MYILNFIVNSYMHHFKYEAKMYYYHFYKAKLVFFLMQVNINLLK